MCCPRVVPKASTNNEALNNYDSINRNTSALQINEMMKTITFFQSLNCTVHDYFSREKLGDLFQRSEMTSPEAYPFELILNKCAVWVNIPSLRLDGELH